MQDARILKTFHKCLAGGYKCVIIVTKIENYTPINILLDYKILRQSINQEETRQLSLRNFEKNILVKLGEKISLSDFPIHEGGI